MVKYLKAGEDFGSKHFAGSGFGFTGSKQGAAHMARGGTPKHHHKGKADSVVKSNAAQPANVTAKAALGAFLLGQVHGAKQANARHRRMKGAGAPPEATQPPVAAPAPMGAPMGAAPMGGGALAGGMAKGGKVKRMAKGGSVKDSDDTDTRDPRMQAHQNYLDMAAARGHFARVTPPGDTEYDGPKGSKLRRQDIENEYDAFGEYGSPGVGVLRPPDKYKRAQPDKKAKGGRVKNLKKG